LRNLPLSLVVVNSVSEDPFQCKLKLRVVGPNIF
jgi:hypothetical protein